MERVAVSSIYADGFAGHVRVHHFNGSARAQLGDNIDGEAAGDNSGLYLALSSDGETVAIGARGIDDASSNAGHLRVFRFSLPSASQSTSPSASPSVSPNASPSPSSSGKASPSERQLLLAFIFGVYWFVLP